MLTDIYIRDLLTIETLRLHLETGTTMITGETGAGKSVFIEAIDIALGGRASNNLIRQGKEKAEVILQFDISHFPKVIEKLRHADLLNDQAECIIRRVILQDGRSRCYVNDTVSTLQFVKELGELLFHLHSQHEQQILLRQDTQRDMLDRYGDHHDHLLQIKINAEALKQVQQQIEQLQKQIEERANRSQFLQFQLEEFSTLNIQQNEWATLEAEHKRLTHAEELMRQAEHVLTLINGDHAHPIQLLLKEIRKTSDAMLQHEPRAANWTKTIHSLFIQLEDLEADIKQYLDQTSLDPDKLQQIETRVGQFFNLARKHKISPEQLSEFQQKLLSELNMLDQHDHQLQELINKKIFIERTYQLHANHLTIKREKAAKKLAQLGTATIRGLSLPHSEFHIHLEPETNTFSSYGNEKIVFLIKINPDQGLSPIQRAISGGELSRLSLALHLALAHRTTIPTLIFDEVDTGLSGATAEKIGKLLRTLGESYQVFCITHQAQVAALGHHHVLVEKGIIDNTTHTRLRLLTKAERAQELARMLGGEKITEKTLAHAEELLLTS